MHIHNYCSFASYYFINFSVWLFFFSFSFSLSSPFETNSSSFLLPHLLFPLLQSNTPIRTIQHGDTQTHPHRQTNRQLMDRWRRRRCRLWVNGSGSVVEISISRSIGSVDQCLWKRSLLVEEIGHCDKEGNLSVRA